MRLSVEGLKDAKIGFEPLPAGEYTLQVEKVEQAPTQSGFDQLRWALTVIENDEHNGTYVWHNTPLNPKGASILKEFLLGAGVKIEADGTFDPEEAVGNVMKVQIGHREYQGNVQHTIKKVLLPEGVE